MQCIHSTTVFMYATWQWRMRQVTKITGGFVANANVHDLQTCHYCCPLTFTTNTPVYFKSSTWKGLEKCINRFAIQCPKSCFIFASVKMCLSAGSAWSNSKHNAQESLPAAPLDVHAHFIFCVSWLDKANESLFFKQDLIGCKSRKFK